MPSFVTHNEVSRDFSIFTDQLSDTKSYSVQVISTIEVPDDHSRTNFRTTTAQVSFSLNVGATCESAEFVEWSLPGQSYTNTVKGEPQVVAIGPVQDTVSKINGNQDGLTYCGKRVYRIVDDSSVASFLTIDQEA